MGDLGDVKNQDAGCKLLQKTKININGRAGVRSGFVLFKWRTPEQYKRTNTPKNMFNKGQILLIFWYFVDKHHYILSDYFVLGVKKTGVY